MAGSAGDNGPAIAAQLNGPQSVAVDPTGRVYIGECGNTGNVGQPTSLRIRAVDQTGTIRTLASITGCPFALATDSSSNVYVSTAINSIFRISQAGTVTHIAGNGNPGGGYGGDGGQAINAQFNYINDIAVDNRSGTLYVADAGNFRLRAISPTGTVQTVAGTGVQGFSGDGGQANVAELNGPVGVTIDEAGNLYIADSGTGSYRIRMIAPTGVISTIGGNDSYDNQNGNGNGDGGRGHMCRRLRCCRTIVRRSEQD